MLPTRLSPPATDPEEWRLRRELTDFYHLIDYLGWTEMIFNHISVRLPGTAHHYLVNPFGLNYREITPENLLKVVGRRHETHRFRSQQFLRRAILRPRRLP
jgi:ribulose-5-phosphate 4-epimerase/fuculose-1-phosphate aldolase